MGWALGGWGDIAMPFCPSSRSPHTLPGIRRAVALFFSSGL